jgi:hypothetical protein
MRPLVHWCQAHLLALLRTLLQLPDLCSLRVQRHLHEEHLSLLGDKVGHILLLLPAIACGGGDEVELGLAHGRRVVLTELLRQRARHGPHALLPHVLRLQLLALLALARGLLIAQRKHLLVCRHVERVGAAVRHGR